MTEVPLTLFQKASVTLAVPSVTRLMFSPEAPVEAAAAAPLPVSAATGSSSFFFSSSFYCGTAPATAPVSAFFFPSRTLPSPP